MKEFCFECEFAEYANVQMFKYESMHLSNCIILRPGVGASIKLAVVCGGVGAVEYEAKWTELYN